jgi:hypothetical protein
MRFGTFGLPLKRHLTEDLIDERESMVVRGLMLCSVDALVQIFFRRHLAISKNAK